MNEYIKRDEESITSYWIRLYKNRKSYGLTFKECGQLMNEVTGEDWNEAKWRREMEGFLKVSEYLQQENPTGLNSNELQEIQEEKLELEKEKIKMRDQRRMMNTRIRELARLEHLEDYLKENIESIEPINIPVNEKQEQEEKEATILLSDWHIGSKIDNSFNKYNFNIAKQRVAKIKEKTLNTVIKENITTLNIVNLGDMISGLIHVSTRLNNEEDVIEQIVKVTELLKDFIGEFLQLGINVKYYNVIGNHSRTIANKKEITGIEENFEKLILTMLDTTFSQYLNYTSFGCKDGFIESEIKGKKIIYAHGDLDSNRNAPYKLPQLLSYVPNYLFTGHIHHDVSKDFGTTLSIVNGSVMGLDGYAVSGRFASRPMQKLVLFDNNGDIDYIKNIYLD